jgi:GcrA cell cycle regulator
MRGAAWDDDRIALLKRLWAEGETAGAIGKRLGGLSRAAVLGKIHRLRLDAEEPAKAAAKVKAAVRAKKPSPAMRGSAPSRRHRSKKAESDPARPSAGTGPRVLFDLTNECCRFPYVPPPQMAV